MSSFSPETPGFPKSNVPGCFQGPTMREFLTDSEDVRAGKLHLLVQSLISRVRNRDHRCRALIISSGGS